jgi:hypothetical protein
VCNSVAYQICYGYKQEEEDNGGWDENEAFYCWMQCAIYTKWKKKVDKRSFSTVFIIFSFEKVTQTIGELPRNRHQASKLFG